jgi:hypothetical protein
MIMSRNTKSKICNIIPVLAIFAVSVVWLVPSSAMARETSGSLSFTASVDKVRYVLGEPVFLTVRLLNTSAVPVSVPKYLDAGEGIIVVRITTPKRKTFGYMPLTLIDSDMPMVTLKPREATADVVPIFYGARGWTFPEPGTYTITAGFKPIGKKQVVNKAKPLTLTVGTDTAGALVVKEGLTGDEAGKFLLWQSGDHLRKGIALLENITEKYPDSIISDYAGFALGKSLNRHFKNFSSKKIRLPDYKRSLEYLKKVRADKLPLYLRIQYNLARAKCHVELNESEQFTELINQTRKLMTDRPELLRFEEHIIRLTRRLR